MPRLKPRTVKKFSFIMRNILNEGKPKNKFEDVDEEVSEAAVQETLDWLGKPAGKSRLPWRLMLCSRAPTTRARFLEHAARSLAWTTRNSLGLVEKACET